MWTASCAVISACSSVPDAPLEVRPALESSAEKLDRKMEFIDAAAAFDSEDFNTAIAHYRNLAWERPKDVAAQLGLIDSALALGLADEAARHLKQAKMAAPTAEQSAKLLAADVLLDLRRDDVDVELRLNEALEMNLDDHRLWNALGHFHDSQENWMSAMETYVVALKKSYAATGRAQSSIINNMGMSLLLQGRRDEARAKFEQALQLRPGARLYDNNRRLVLMLNGDIIGAVKDVDEKRAAKIYADAGAMAEARGDHARARGLLLKALETSPVYLAGAADTLSRLDTNP